RLAIPGLMSGKRVANPHLDTELRARSSILNTRSSATYRRRVVQERHTGGACAGQLGQFHPVWKRPLKPLEVFGVLDDQQIARVLGQEFLQLLGLLFRLSEIEDRHVLAGIKRD